MASPAAEQPLLDDRNPLRHAGILELILSFLDGDGFFVLSVNKSWKAMYNKLLARSNAIASRVPVPCRPRRQEHIHNTDCTSRQAVFASPSRVQLAIASKTGLEFNELDHPANWRIQFAAGRFADVATLLAARELGLPFSCRVVAVAAASGSISTLDWLLTDQQCPMPEQITSECEHIEMLRWLKQRGCAPTTVTLSNAAETPSNRPLLQYFIDEGCTLGKGCISAAAKGNDFKQLKWLHAKGAPILQSATWDAAHHNRRVVLEWLHERGAEYNHMTMRSAAECGHIKLCQWLREQGCEWDSTACEFAAAYGEVETLDWLLTHGCPWTLTYWSFEHAAFLRTIQQCLLTWSSTA
jgi:hypothetical protein